jgi:hypothetical protein
MRTRLITGACIVAVGAIWIAQGLGLIRGSGFMDGVPFWAALGAVFVVTGSAIALIAWRDSRRRG